MKDEAAAYRVAGFNKVGKQWRACEDSESLSYEAGKIEKIDDFNQDGKLDALITESSAMCYGNAGVAYYLVTNKSNGKWKLITKGVGTPKFLKTLGVEGWPDLEIGGPSFCFPVQRWNGKSYVLNRHQYENKVCSK